MNAVIFDIDGTLIRCGGAGQQAMAASLSTTFGVPADTGSVCFAGRTDRQIVSELFEWHGIPVTAANWRRFRCIGFPHAHKGAQVAHVPD